MKRSLSKENEILLEREKSRYREIRETFSTESGKKVLDDLKKRYVDSALFAPTDAERTVNIAKHDLVQDLVSIVEMGELELDEQINYLREKIKEVEEGQDFFKH